MSHNVFYGADGNHWSVTKQESVNPVLYFGVPNSPVFTVYVEINGNSHNHSGPDVPVKVKYFVLVKQ